MQFFVFFMSDVSYAAIVFLPFTVIIIADFLFVLVKSFVFVITDMIIQCISRLCADHNKR